LYAFVVVPYRQRNAERRENDRLRALVERHPSFDLIANPFGFAAKSIYPEFKEEPWIADHCWLFPTHQFRITNTSDRPLELAIRLFVPLLGDDHGFKGDFFWVSGTLRDFPLLGQAKKPDDKLIVADLQNRWLRSPIRVEPASSTYKDRLLFLYDPPDGLRRDHVDLDRLKLEMHDYQSGFVWNVPVGPAFGVGPSFSADHLTEYVVSSSAISVG